MLVTGVYKKHFVAVLIHNCPELGTDAGEAPCPVCRTNRMIEVRSPCCEAQPTGDCVSGVGGWGSRSLLA